MSKEEHEHIPGTKPVSGYEAAGVRVRAMAWFVVGFVLSVAVILVGLWWLEKPFIRGGYSESRELGQFQVDQPLEPSPGHPQLPWEDLKSLQHEQEARLDGYGILPGDPSRAHIPISRAMDLLLQGGDLNKAWSAPTTMPYKMETEPSPYTTPSVRNRT